MSTAEIATLIDELAVERIQLYVEHKKLRHRAPPGALTPERQALIRAHRNEIYDFVRERSRSGMRPPLVTDAEAVWAPSPLQAMILTGPPLYMTDVRSWSYVNPEACQAALNEVIARHDALRTRYTTDDAGRYWAVTERRRVVTIENIDLSTLLPESARLTRCLELAQARKQPFDRNSGPLLRFALVKIGEHATISILTACHSILDRLSAAVLHRELLELHRAFDTGRSPELPPAPRFRDYARLLNGRVNGEIGYQDFLHVWDRVLGIPLDFPAPVAPEDAITNTENARPTPSVIRVNGIGAEELEALRNLVHGERMTLFAGVLTAVAIALSVCARSSDAFVWVIDSGRTSPLTVDLIGCCALHLPFAIRLSSNLTLREALHATWHTHLEDRKHLAPAQYVVPITKRAAARGIFVTTELNYQRIDAFDVTTGQEVGGNSARFDVRSEKETTLFSLRATFYESEHGLIWAIRNKTPVTSDATAERFCDIIGDLLRRMVSELDAKLDSVRADIA